MSENSNTGFWFGFILGMQIILIILKLKGLVNLTWLLVLTPMSIIGYAYLFLLIIMLILSVANYYDNREFNKLKKKLKNEWKKLHKSGQV